MTKGKMGILIALLLSWLQLCFAQSKPTIEQCRTTANYLLALSATDLEKLQKQMTAGDELVYSTQVAKCLEEHPAELSKTQVDRLDRIAYRFDADVISRMYNFLERHKLADKFNDEEQARKSK